MLCVANQVCSHEVPRAIWRHIFEPVGAMGNVPYICSLQTGNIAELVHLHNNAPTTMNEGFKPHLTDNTLHELRDAEGLRKLVAMQVVHYDLPKDTESFLHRSGRTGRAGKSGATIAVLQPRDRQAFRRICQETKISDLSWINTPAPTDVMAASAKQVCSSGKKFG